MTVEQVSLVQHKGQILGPGPTVQLCLPEDWLDLVLDDEPLLRRRIEQTVAPVDREAVLSGLLAWRARPGLLSHGIVDVHQDGLDASWHVVTSAVPVPVSDDADAAAVLRRMLGGASPAGHVEAFDIPQGRAVGLVEERVLEPPDAVPGDAVSSGLVAVLSLPRGSRLGLLFVGVCLDPAQLEDLIGLVTLMATRSTVDAR